MQIYQMVIGKWDLSYYPHINSLNYIISWMKIRKMREPFQRDSFFLSWNWITFAEVETGGEAKTVENERTCWKVNELWIHHFAAVLPLSCSDLRALNSRNFCNFQVHSGSLWGAENGPTVCPFVRLNMKANSSFTLHEGNGVVVVSLARLLLLFSFHLFMFEIYSKRLCLQFLHSIPRPATHPSHPSFCANPSWNSILLKY